jgi:hypothetical protein
VSGNDRTERDVEARRAAVRLGHAAELRDALRGLGQGLAEHGERVAMLRTHLEGTMGGATEEQRRIGLLQRPCLRDHVLEAVEPALVVERLRGRPHLAHHLEVLGGPQVPFLLGREVALALLVGIAVAHDHVQRDPATRELVERGHRPGRERRRHDPGTMRDQVGEPFRMRGGEARHVEPFGRRRVVPDQHVVEAGGLVRPRKVAQERGRDAPRDHVQCSALWRGDPDHSDDAYRHGVSLCVLYVGTSFHYV